MVAGISLRATRVAALTGALLLTACTGDKGGELSGSCSATSENLLRDSSFDTLFAHHRESQWQASEHAAGQTYEPSVSNGTLSIRKIGKEPWFLIAQSPDAKALAGKTLSFSAELKLDLKVPRHPHGFGYGGGLSIMAKRGGKLTVSSAFEHEPHMGVHDWQPVEVIFKLPKNSTYLRLGFLQQAGGSMQVRNPALRTVAPGCPPTTKGD